MATMSTQPKTTEAIKKLQSLLSGGKKPGNNSSKPGKKGVEFSKPQNVTLNYCSN